MVTLNYKRQHRIVNETIVETLLRAGTDFLLTDNDRWTPIYIVSQNGHTAVVKLFLRNGRGATVFNKNG